MDAYYRRRAKESGVTISDFINRLLVQGVIAENVISVEERMRALIAEIQVSAARTGSPGEQMNPDVVLSVLTSELLLTKIVESRNPQDLYDAQKAAKMRMEKFKER